MTAFHFRLQKLLDLAEHRRQERARQLEAARRGEADAAALLDRSRQARLIHLEGLRETPAEGRLDLDAWSAGRERYRGMRVEESAAAARLRKAEAAVADASSAFVEARREGDVLQRLRDRRHRTWSADQAVAEQAALDDVAGRLRGDAGRKRG